MAGDKKGSKGKFLYLFDWHGKSKRKLFPNNPQSSGSSTGKENHGNSTSSQFLLREGHPGRDGYLHSDKDAYLSKGSGDSTTTSSINGDDGYGTKAPGVVARLMGLETLPISSETNSISSHDYEAHAIGSSYYPRNESGYQHDHYTLDLSYMANRLEGHHWNSVDSRLKIVNRRPIERYQTEVLPPKSAKPISITHHKLLSPIKSPGFVPTNDPAYIMEAAARIIDSTPHLSSLTRTPSFGSTSSPLKMRDLRDKMEAAHRSSILSESSKKGKQSPSAKQLRGGLRERLFDAPLSRSRTSDLETSGLQSSMRKEKAVSPAVRKRDNVQEKKGSTSSSTRSLMQKEKKQIKPKQSHDSHPAAKKSRQVRNATNRSSEVVRQNTEKQNVSSKDKATMKSSIPNQQLRGLAHTDGSVGTSKTLNKVSVNPKNGSKRVVSTTFVADKRPSLNKMNNISRNKELAIKDKKRDDSVADGSSANNAKLTQHDCVVQTGADNKKDGMDVISFTFNSPIKKTGFMPSSSNEATGSNSLVDCGSYDMNDQPDSEHSSSPLLRLKLISGDALSLLLEQKLKELTDKVEPAKSQLDSVMDETGAYSAPTWSDSNFDRSAISADSMRLEECHKHDRDLEYNEVDKREGAEGECSSIQANTFDTREGLEIGHLDNAAPECSDSHGSCISSNSRSNCTYGNTESFACQSEEETNYRYTDNFLPGEDERDVSDTASSLYYEEWEGKHTSASHSVSDFYLPYWELQYLRQILQCTGLKELVLDADSNIIDPSVFDQVENLIISSAANTEDCTKLGRKLLFDCLNECLFLRYEQISFGSYRAWCRWTVLLQREDWLVEELFREIIGVENMGNLMVDELVEKDMGTQYKGWLDFEIEMLEEGNDIEMDIMDSLIDELVFDLSLS